MNDIESRLAGLLKAGVGDPPGRVTVQAVRLQKTRRRGVAAIGAAAAIAVVAALFAGLSGRLGSPSPEVSPTVSAAPVPCRPGWHVAAGAVPAGDYEDRLVAIAGSASDDVWAVGDRFPNQKQTFPLMEHWDGRPSSRAWRLLLPMTSGRSGASRPWGQRGQRRSLSAGTANRGRCSQPTP